MLLVHGVQIGLYSSGDILGEGAPNSVGNGHLTSNAYCQIMIELLRLITSDENDL